MVRETTSIGFLKERIVNLNNSFEEIYDSAKQDGILDSIIEITSRQTPQDTNSNTVNLSMKISDTALSTNTFAGMTAR